MGTRIPSSNTSATKKKSQPKKKTTSGNKARNQKNSQPNSPEQKSSTPEPLSPRDSSPPASLPPELLPLESHPPQEIQKEDTPPPPSYATRQEALKQDAPKLKISGHAFAPSHIELSESALRKNIRFFQEVVAPAARFSSVIKGNAYGHGVEAFVPLAEKCGVRHFSLFSADEAWRAFHSRTQGSDILIMGYIDKDQIAWAIEHGVSFYLFEMERLKEACRLSRQIGRRARVHIELETGLHRTGFEQEELPQIVSFLRDYQEDLRLEGVCTHYAGAESVGNYLRIQKQKENFQQRCYWMEQRGISFETRHTACSAAALTYPETQMDMVRIGISQYGFWPSKETQMHWMLRHPPHEKSRVVDPLRRIIRWVSQVMSVKVVSPGEFVGYGISYQSTKTERIASVPVGYYHGFSRSMSNLGHVLIRGRRAPVVGLVNMNMMMVNVSDIPYVQVGDEVVLIGRQKKGQISVSSFSDILRNLNYEVLVRLPSEIPRLIAP